MESLVPAREEMKICSFLWVYYGYPTSSYEGINVENMRYECGKLLARRDDVKSDMVAGVPDSGIAHAIGYANESGIPFARPFIKYTPTWPRSFMPQNQGERNLIAKMKLIPVDALIRGKSMLLMTIPSSEAHSWVRLRSSYIRAVRKRSISVRPVRLSCLAVLT